MMRFWRILMFGCFIIISSSPSSSSVANAKEAEQNQLNQSDDDLDYPQQHQQQQRKLGDKLNYPDYSWFGGLENRILLEYPQLENLIKLHHEKLNKERNYLRAVELHKEIFKNIYEIEVERNLRSNISAGQANLVTNSSAPSGKGDEQVQIDSAEHRSAYKLFDLWANTPGDFERKQNDYSNYLEPYLIQAHIEFWSYCLDERFDCDQVLRQLMVLARERELGPIELLQVSLNAMMLMNSHKADLVLDRLIERKVISIGHDDEGKGAKIYDELYERKLANLVKLIEIDEDFNEATFNYIFTRNEEIHKIIDSRMESYLADRINKFEAELEQRKQV